MPPKRSQGLTVKIYEEIKKKIINQDFRPGMHLKESWVADLLKASRTPIREALRQLETDGLVIKEPNKGFSVGQMSIAEFYEIIVVREKLEGHAAKLAAQRISDKEMKALKEIHEAYIRFSQKEVPITTLNKFDTRLHHLILQACGNQTIQRILQGLRDKIWQIRRKAPPPRMQKSVREHLRIIEAIQGRDGDAAERAMVAHLCAMKEDFHKQW
jgi:DNA-binding GntR family transcriptional regulator